MNTLSSGGVSPDKRVCTPARWEESLPASWIVYQLIGRNRRAGLCSSSPGGIPPGGVASLGTGYPLGYPDIRQVWAEKQPSEAETAPAGGYPPADSGYPRRIIRDHLYQNSSAIGMEVGIIKGIR
ncbi:hypothetical protein PGT21_019924 [Puccinia graminis f. sp. tritici]|uniref:Uncharacterized protein n=1 Tax=Puccinia graminis f. sp. tritici TaxID=56615 RepID=A0A5B0Q699_PUCGR|nr:hypothetical protein PGT21_019924 [Puccinia graminis f. sp. tritici]